ncbi:hypothetical protein [Aeromicrobium sp. 179-A 4D2 NHS]|uniref:hypothetical protein n=1 Tax=Aeromicrobium sp. 179-A 4D2 NHS TaxID=3142375 RepID=UPI0039A2168B
MSTATSPRALSRSAAARSSALASGLAARGRDARDVGLKLVGPVRVRARRAPFVVVVLGVLAVGLVGLILLSTAMQAQAFRIDELQQRATLLHAQKEQLATEVDQMQSPSGLAERALSEGMVPNANPVFLRLTDGKVIGEPVPAERGTNVRRAG